MLVRVKPGDMQEVVQYMQETWSGIVDYADFKFSFLQQDLEAAYRDELHWRQLINLGCGRRGVHLCLGCFWRLLPSPPVAAPRRSVSARLSVPASLGSPR